MSQENVELTQALTEAWNAGDMDAVREFYDPDVVLRPNKDWPEQGPFFGREAVMQWLEQLRDTWDTLVIETISRIDAGDRIIERQIPHGMGQGPAYEA
jgi:ketosteroid isomerase-like protein